jgi:hypothetical protein
MQVSKFLLYYFHFRRLISLVQGNRDKFEFKTGLSTINGSEHVNGRKIRHDVEINNNNNNNNNERLPVIFGSFL